MLRTSREIQTTPIREYNKSYTPIDPTIAFRFVNKNLVVIPCAKKSFWSSTALLCVLRDGHVEIRETNYDGRSKACVRQFQAAVKNHQKEQKFYTLRMMRQQSH